MPLWQLDDLKTTEDVAYLKEKLAAVLAVPNVADKQPDNNYAGNIMPQLNNPAEFSVGSESLSDPADISFCDINLASERDVMKVDTIFGAFSVSSGHENNDEYAGTPYSGALYAPVDIPVTPVGWAEYCLPSNKAEIARRALMIVENEGVILRDKLMEKLRTSFGVKNSEKVSEATEKALKAAQIKTTKVKGIPHCWASAVNPKTYTSFRYHEEVKRKDDELTLPELRNAVVRTLMDNGPLDEDDLLVRTARTFGYQRLGPNLRNRLLEGVAYALSDKLIRLNKQKKYELREA